MGGDVGAMATPVEAHQRRGLVGSAPRTRNGVSETGDAEDPPAVRHDPAVVNGGSGMEDECARRLCRIEPVDRRAGVTALGIVGGRDHDGHRRARRSFQRDAGEIACRRSGERPEQVTVDERKDRLRLGISEAAVVLEHFRPVGGHHQPGEEQPGERCSASSKLLENGCADALDELVELIRSEVAVRRVRAHATGVRPVVPVVGALEVLRGRERDRPTAVADREQRDLGAFQQLLDHDLTAESLDVAEPSVELVLGVAHDDALAGGEAVGLDHAGWTGDGERGSRRHAGGVHHVLRKSLRPLDPRSRGTRAEHGDAGGS